MADVATTATNAARSAFSTATQYLPVALGAVGVAAIATTGFGPAVAAIPEAVNLGIAKVSSIFAL